jgi:ubiquinone/menaquinone biosynthesis C-methylase UbiE
MAAAIRLTCRGVSRHNDRHASKCKYARGRSFKRHPALWRSHRACAVNREEFDKFALEYETMHAANIRASGETPAFFAEYKVKDVALSLMESQLQPGSILDFGAGIGTSVPFFRQYLPRARLTCLDVSAKSLQLGRSRFADAAEFTAFDGQSIPFPDGSFDVCFAACVFHHIPAEEHLGLMREFRRVLRSGGMAFVFEHNPYNPLTVRAVRDCAFDENAVLIRAADLRSTVRQAGFSQVRSAYRIFFPRVFRMLRPLERLLTWCPMGAQYYVQANK